MRSAAPALTRSPAWLALSLRVLLPSRPAAFLATAAPDPRIAAAAAGDRAAAQALCLEILPRVRNLVRYLLRGDHDVDDIAQEALIAVLRGLGGYRGEGKFESWVDRIVARATFAHIGRRRDERARASNDAPELLPDAGDASGERYVLRRQLAAVLDQLSDEQRHALVLHHAMGMTVPEIAALIGAPVETVRSRLRLGIAAMRRLLGDTEPNEEEMP
jgi:RNA polymerase sigma-70 factor (ECF subfamily)